MRVSTASRIRYVPKADRDLPPAERTTFILRPLSVREFLDLREIDAAADWLAPNLAALALGLVGWEGLRDETGASVQFARDPGADASAQPYLALLDLPTVGEIAGAIIDAASVSRAEAGKSSTPSGSPSAASATSATPA